MQMKLQAIYCTQILRKNIFLVAFYSKCLVIVFMVFFFFNQSKPFKGRTFKVPAGEIVFVARKSPRVLVEYNVCARQSNSFAYTAAAIICVQQLKPYFYAHYFVAELSALFSYTMFYE